MTEIAAGLSNKSNIRTTELFVRLQEIKRLRTIIQHCKITYKDDYFIDLPDNHPLKEFIRTSPSGLSQDTRAILDHYSLKSGTP